MKRRREGEAAYPKDEILEIAEPGEWVVIRLTPEAQAHLIEGEPDVFGPVPGAWGARG